MAKNILKRILISIPVLTGVVLIIFIMLRVVPGDPVTTMLGEHVNQTVIDKISKEMGLDKPLYIQFFTYISHAIRGDFGTSYRMNRNVTGIILDAFPNTVRLAVCAAIVSWIVGIAAGIFAAVNKNNILDRLFMGGALLGVSMPVFMIALVLQYLFAYKLKIFPVSGYETITSALVEFGRKHCKNDQVKYLRGNAGRLYKDCQSKRIVGVCCNEITCSKECNASCSNYDGIANFIHAFRSSYHREYIWNTGNRQTCSECNRNQRYAAFTRNGYFYNYIGDIGKFDSRFIVFYSGSQN